MSDAMERTLASLPRFLSEGLGLSTSTSPKNYAASRSFQSFLHNLHRARSKYEEEQLVQRELSQLQRTFSQPDGLKGQLRDCMSRVIFCHMSGYDVSFSHIHAVKLAQQGAGIEKKIGYLATTILLHEGHELVLLLVNTIQRDLKSSNFLENCMALSAICQLVNPELVPMLLPLVQDKLKHSRELVREKAVICLHRFMQCAPDLVQHMSPQVEGMLGDKDPGVMAATVQIFYHNIKEHPKKYIDSAGSLMNILSQIISRKMPAMFEYHSIPFPWLQILLLRCLALLGSVSESVSKELSPLLKELLQRTNLKENMAFGIVYECIVTITSIKAESLLQQEAAKHIGRFLKSTQPNLKYIGVKALTCLVKVSPQYATDYQALVVELLEDTDQTVQRQVYDLLYCMANPVNVQVICSKLLDQLHRTTDKFWQLKLVTMVTQLADKFPVSQQWYLETLFLSVEFGKHTVTPEVVNKIISVIQKGCEEGENKDLRQFVVKKAVEYLVKPKICCELVQVAVWVVGEFAILLKKIPEEKLATILCKHLCDTDFPSNKKGWIITALIKLFKEKILSKETVIVKTKEILDTNPGSLVHLRLQILLQLASCDVDLDSTRNSYGKNLEQIDFSLSFLDDIVSEALEGGAAPYKPKHLRQTSVAVESVVSSEPNLNYQPYSESSPMSSIATTSRARSDSSTSGVDTKISDSGLNLSSVKKVWGKQGRIKEETKTIHSPARMREADQMQDSVNVQELEAERKKHELAAALFGGISTQDSSETSNLPPSTNAFSLQSAQHDSNRLHSPLIQKSTSMTDEQSEMYSLLPKSDTGGWRKVQQTYKEENCKDVGQKNENVEKLEQRRTSVGVVRTSDITHVDFDLEQNDSSSLYNVGEIPPDIAISVSNSHTSARLGKYLATEPASTSEHVEMQEKKDMEIPKQHLNTPFSTSVQNLFGTSSKEDLLAKDCNVRRETTTSTTSSLLTLVGSGAENVENLSNEALDAALTSLLNQSTAGSEQTLQLYKDKSKCQKFHGSNSPEFLDQSEEERDLVEMDQSNKPERMSCDSDAGTAGSLYSESKLTTEYSSLYEEFIDES